MDDRSSQGSTPDLQQLLQLAGSPAGQQLLSKVKQQSPDLFQQALSGAASGDISKAKKSILELLKDPRVAQLVKDFGGQRHE